MTSTAEHSRPGLGILFRIAAGVFFAIMGALVKAASQMGVPIIQIVFFRSLFALIPVLIWMQMQGGPRLLATKRPMAHIKRAAVGVVSMVFTFLGLAYLPLNEATAINFSMPLFATILVALVLSESVGRHRWTAVAVGFVGVLIIVRPDPTHFIGWGVAFALLAAFGQAGVTVLIRQISTTENPIAITFYFAVISGLVSLILLPFFWVSMNWAMLAAVVALGIAGGFGQLFMTLSLRHAPVSLVVPFDYTTLLWVGLIAFLFFGEVPHMAMLIGAPIVMGSGLYILWREKVRMNSIQQAAVRPYD